VDKPKEGIILRLGREGEREKKTGTDEIVGEGPAGFKFFLGGSFRR